MKCVGERVCGCVVVTVVAAVVAAVVAVCALCVPWKQVEGSQCSLVSRREGVIEKKHVTGVFIARNARAQARTGRETTREPSANQPVRMDSCPAEDSKEDAAFVLKDALGEEAGLSDAGDDGALASATI